MYSSCNCYQCETNATLNDNGTPTNMSVVNCQVPSSLNCVPELLIKTSIEPNNLKNNIIELNPFQQNKYDNTYHIINNSACGNYPTYFERDPRLYNAASNSWLQLDKPPLNSTVKLKNVYDDNLYQYGKNYTSYKDVNSGQITYYIDESIQNAFFNPLFVTPAKTIGTLYQDPMSSLKPQWNREPPPYNPVIHTSINVGGDTKLSFLKDTQYNREDMLSLQMRKRNQQKYETRWT